jgi:DNA repair exonuclease SbcCD ATPase subunit
MKIRTTSLVAVLCLAPIIAFSPGCESTESVRQQRERVVEQKTEIDAAVKRANANVASMQKTIDDLRSDRERLVATVAQLEAGSAERAAVETAIAAASSSMVEISKRIEDAFAKIDRATAISSELGKRIATADKIIETSAPGTPNPGSDVGSLIGMVIPGAATLAPIIGGLVWRGARLARAKMELEGEVTKKTVAIDRIVASIDALAEIAPEVRTAISKHSAVIDTIQTPIGKIEVDAAQSRNSTPVIHG